MSLDTGRWKDWYCIRLSLGLCWLCSSSGRCPLADVDTPKFERLARQGQVDWSHVGYKVIGTRHIGPRVTKNGVV